MASFIDKLRRLIGAENLFSFANRNGLTRGIVRGWMEGHSPTLANLQQLSKATGIPTSYWCDDSVDALDEREAKALVVVPSTEVVGPSSHEHKPDVNSPCQYCRRLGALHKHVAVAYDLVQSMGQMLAADVAEFERIWASFEAQVVSHAEDTSKKARRRHS